jgi:hypothetical protein
VTNDADGSYPRYKPIGLSFSIDREYFVAPNCIENFEGTVRHVKKFTKPKFNSLDS